MESNKKITHLIILTSLLFFSLILYLTYFQMFKSANLAGSPYNKRQWARENNTIRGNIYDRNGVVLAETTLLEESKTKRIYPQGHLYSHVIGYSDKQYGKTGIEFYYNNELLAISDNPILKILEQISNDMIKGNHLVLTIDHELQKVAEKQLRGKRGSVVALDPKTGEVLAMVSKPDYDPNTLQDQWEGLVNDENSPLLNRSLSGLYPPGSIYKTIIGAAVLENPEVDPQYNCEGTITIDGYTLKDAVKGGHGSIGLKESIVKSCNTNFGRMAVALGQEKVTEISKRFLMAKDLGGDMPVSQSRYPYDSNMNPTDMAAVGIGQGKLLVTPMHMATVAATFANKGILMTPHIVKEVQNSEGRPIDFNEGKEINVISEGVAGEITEMMVAAVDRGTGGKAKISGVKVAGKTGTAQNETGESHAWFIGFAPASDPQIAIAVILEAEGRSGGDAAAPIAKAVMEKALRGGQ